MPHYLLQLVFVGLIALNLYLYLKDKTTPNLLAAAFIYVLLILL